MSLDPKALKAVRKTLEGHGRLVGGVVMFDISFGFVEDAIEAYLAHAPTSLHNLQGTPAGWRTDEAPMDITLLLRCPESYDTDGVRIGWRTSDGWFEDESASHQLTDLYGPVTGWNYISILSAAPPPPAAVGAEPKDWTVGPVPHDRKGIVDRLNRVEDHKTGYRRLAIDAAMMIDYLASLAHPSTIRAETIEECAKVADSHCASAVASRSEALGQVEDEAATWFAAQANAARDIAAALRSLALEDGR